MSNRKKSVQALVISCAILSFSFFARAQKPPAPQSTQAPAATAPQAPQPASPPAGELPIDQLKKSVVFLSGIAIVDGHPAEWNGTGFLIFVDTPDLGKDQGLVWLVTNRHMLYAPGSNTLATRMILRSNLRQPRDGSYIGQDILPVTNSNGELLWDMDPDPTVDLAILRVSPDESKMDAVWLPAEIFLTKEKATELHVNENDEVFFAGFFRWFSGTKKNAPIVRHGRIALVTDERILVDLAHPENTQDLLLAEVTSFGGNSGSPVFLRISGIREGASAVRFGYQYYFLGVMEGFLPENTQFSIETRTITGQTVENSGIAAIVPASHVLHILSLPRPTAEMELVRARVLLKSGRLDDAQKAIEKAVPLFASAVGKKSPQYVDALQVYADLLSKQGRNKELKAIREEIRTIAGH